MWSFLTNFWDNLKELVSDFTIILLKPFLYIIDIINYILDILIEFISKYIDYANNFVNSISSEWLNPAIPAIPDFLVTALKILNSFFPVDTFLVLAGVLVSLWTTGIILRLLIRLITLGQA